SRIPPAGADAGGVVAALRARAARSVERLAERTTPGPPVGAGLPADARAGDRRILRQCKVPPAAVAGDGGTRRRRPAGDPRRGARASAIGPRPRSRRSGRRVAL